MHLMALNIAALLAFLGFVVVLAKRDAVKTYLLLPLILQGLEAIPSLIFIESGGFISEQGRFGHFNGATVYFTLYAVGTVGLSWLGIALFQRSLASVGVSRLREDYPILVALLWSMLAVAFLNLVLSPIPLFSDQYDRFDYWEIARFPFLKYLLGNVSGFLVIGAGVMYLHRRATGKLFLALYLAYLILLGHKFGSIVTAVYMFYLPHVIYNRPRFRAAVLLRPSTILGALGVGLLVYLHYRKENPMQHVVGDNVTLGILYRAFGLQGHVWWGMVEHAKQHAPTYNVSELAYGMHSLMYSLSADPKLVDLAIQRGVSFTNGYPAILLKVFPVPLAVLFQLGVIAVTALFTAMTIRFVLGRQWILTVVSAQMTSWWFHILLMGFFYKAGQVAVLLLFTIGYLLVLRAVGRGPHSFRRRPGTRLAPASGIPGE